MTEFKSMEIFQKKDEIKLEIPEFIFEKISEIEVVKAPCSTVIIGKSGVGKTSFIKCLLKIESDKVFKIGSFTDTTKNDDLIVRIHDDIEQFKLRDSHYIFDSEGIKDDDVERSYQNLKQILTVLEEKKKPVDFMIYCFAANSDRINSNDVKLIRKLQKQCQVLIVFTKIDDVYLSKLNSMIEFLIKESENTIDRKNIFTFCANYNESKDGLEFFHSEKHSSTMQCPKCNGNEQPSKQTNKEGFCYCPTCNETFNSCPKGCNQPDIIIKKDRYECDSCHATKPISKISSQQEEIKNRIIELFQEINSKIYTKIECEVVKLNIHEKNGDMEKAEESKQLILELEKEIAINNSKQSQWITISEPAKKVLQSSFVIGSSVVAAIFIGACPIPLSDALLLGPLQISMLGLLKLTWKTRIKAIPLEAILSGLGLLATQTAGLSISSILKTFVGPGTVAMGATNGAIAGSLTLALGVLFSIIFSIIWHKYGGEEVSKEDFKNIYSNISFAEILADARKLPLKELKDPSKIHEIIVKFGGIDK